MKAHMDFQLIDESFGTTIGVSCRHDIQYSRFLQRLICLEHMD